MRVYQHPACPQEAGHGPLLPWTSALAGFHCPNVRHRGFPFYTTDLAAVPRPAADGLTDSRSARTRQQRTGALVGCVGALAPRTPAAGPPDGSGLAGLAT